MRIEYYSYSEIGREYRKNFKKLNAKKLTIHIVSAFGITICVTLVALFCLGVVGFAKSWFELLFLTFVLGTLPALEIAVPLIVLKAIFRKKALKRSDEWIGKKYCYENKRVKTSAIRRMKPFLIAFPIVSLCAAIFTFGIVMESAFTSPVNESDLLERSGTIESIELLGKKSRYFKITLSEDTFTYIIHDSSYYGCDKSVIEDDIVGKNAILQIYSSNNESNVYVYSFKTEDKEYLKYSDYLDEFNKDKNITTSIFIGGLTVTATFVGMAIGIGVYTIIRSFKEDIIPQNSQQ